MEKKLDQIKQKFLLKGIKSKKINGHKFQEIFNYIVKNDIEKIITKKPSIKNETNMIKFATVTRTCF